jgi:hypothetical protein
MSGSRAFHPPLNEVDTETTTLGCRGTNSDICAKNEMPNVCAFVRADGLCAAPPGSWPKQFRRLPLFQNARNQG